jgi:hypothetical protein
MFIRVRVQTMHRVLFTFMYFIVYMLLYLSFRVNISAYARTKSMSTNILRDPFGMSALTD